VVADLNGDGKPDVAVTNNNGSDISVMFGDGTGAMGGTQTILVGDRPTGLAIGDLNGDDLPDLVVANGSSNSVSVLLGTGGGGFSASSNPAVGTAPTSVAIRDLNGDGILDLVVANSGCSWAQEPARLQEPRASWRELGRAPWRSET